MSCCGSSGDTQDPCSLGTNTAACETLPSALDNFIAHFFGTVVKTENAGVVTWSLPCGLDVGLTNNPRAADEGLACYFLRLFDEGITGLVGPAGLDGANGATGNNAYSVTLASFTQPALGSPNWSVKANPNPAMMVGGTVFIQDSGWHTITAIGSDGTLFLALIDLLSGAASGTITAGKIVNMTGPQGIVGNTGGQGIQGVKGDTGAAGDEFTPTHDLVVGSGAHHSLTLASTVVIFGTTQPEVTLPAVGTYRVDVIVGVRMAPGAATLPPETLVFKLWNATLGAFVLAADGGEETVQCFEPNEEGQIVMRAFVTTAAANSTLQLYGEMSVASFAEVLSDRTSLSYMRMS
jgi:hypothetical protein